MLKRIRYISEFSKTMSETELRALAEQSAANNKRDGITGLLVSTGNLFFQLIEGPPDRIDACYQRIREDKRHTNVLLLDMEMGNLTRLCPDWDMKGIDLSDESHRRFNLFRALLRGIHVQQMTAENLRLALEEAVWHEFLTAESDALH